MAKERMTTLILTEPLIENYTDLAATIQAGHKRIALANNLADGGSTVSKGVMAEAVRYAHDHQVTLDLLIAPRGGKPVYNDVELKIMEADLLEAQQLGVDGVILGALTTDNALDVEGLQLIIAAAGGMTLTFSTAYDAIAPEHREAALNWLAEQGFDYLLSHDDEAGLLATHQLVQKAGLILIPASLTATETQSVTTKLGLNLVFNSQI